jgi:outer membrane protein OmpA-like peptidoglycan-associated protein/tetratricopeptide (TPR) repeat protein
MVEMFHRAISKHNTNTRPFMFRKEMKNIGCMILLGCLLIMAPKHTMAQKSKFKLADKFYQTMDYTMSGNIYRDIVASARYANDTLALRRLAYGELYLGKLIDSESYFNKLVKLNAATEKDYITLADVLKKQGRYADAMKVYEKVLAVNPNNDIAKRHLEQPNFVEGLKQDSMIYTIRNSDINSAASDFAPAFFIKNQVLFSSSRANGSKSMRTYKRTEQSYLDIYLADVAADSSLKSARPISDKINTRYHEGTMTYHAVQGKVYFTRNNYLDGKVNKDKSQNLKLAIYSATYNAEKNQFTAYEPFPYNNPSYSVGHPTLNASGNRLYFVSDMPGGMGGTDIYYCELKDNAWSTPVNAGSKINTSGDEMFPFMVNDSIMYFASNGHVGLGGLDLFYTNVLTDAPVLNAGYPASTRYDDFALICHPDEVMGYFSSSRKGGKGDDDIYEYRLKPVDTVLVSGTVYDLESMKPLAGVLIKVPTADGSVVEVMTDNQGKYSVKAPYAPEVNLEASKQGYLPATGKGKTNPRSSKLENVDIKMKKFDAMSNGKVIYAENNQPAEGALIQLLEIANGDTTVVDSIRIPSKGTYEFPLYAKKNYMLLVTHEGYARQTASISTHNITDRTYTRDFKLFKPKVGEVVRLDNIYYDYNSAVIRPDAARELDKLVQILTDNPTMKIELSSHSDSRGSDKYNLELSDKRAKSAVAYIISQGISPDRVYGKGYGELKILNHCKNDVKCTEEEHQFNRRTEFTITAF